MNTAQQIAAKYNLSPKLYADQVAAESEARELSFTINAPNCFDRTFGFWDGSTITKTRDGFVAA